jgi:hypothetical protein
MDLARVVADFRAADDSVHALQQKLAMCQITVAMMDQDEDFDAAQKYLYLRLMDNLQHEVNPAHRKLMIQARRSLDLIQAEHLSEADALRVWVQTFQPQRPIEEYFRSP